MRTNLLTTAHRLILITMLSGLVSCAHMADPACPSAQDLRPEMLHGQWTVQVVGESPWALTLGPHPEHAGSLQGTLSQGPQRHAVVADLDDGEFTLEESHDGQRIAATWLGSLSTGACARQIQGQRTLAGQGPRDFWITRQP